MAASSQAFRLVAVLLVVPAAGCLSSTYVIPRQDALALTQLAPERRGDSVRVVQEIFADTPERAPSVTGSTQLDLAPRVYVFGGVSGGSGVGGSGVGGGAVGGGTVAVAPPGGGGTVGVTPGGGTVGAAPTAGTVGVTPAPGGTAPGGTAPNPSGSGGTGGGSGGSGGSGGGGDGTAVVVVVVVALSAVVALVLAGTEGARYDGWARLNPMHPVHVLASDGSTSWVPLALLDAQTAAAATELLVSEDEGPFLTLGRAPLNRVGFVYGMEGGVASLRGRRGLTGAAFAAHVQLGFFPLQQLGLLFDTLLGLGDRDGNTLVNAQFGGELQALPLALGPVHLGAFGRVGTASPTQRDERWALSVGGGGLVQLELTTRLALTLRGGATYVNEARGGVVTGEGMLGLAVY